jgi:hypothetical protein
MSSRRVALSATFLMLAAGGTAACDSSYPGDGGENPNEDGHFYCTDANGTVIDESYCDEDSENYNSGMFFMYMGSSMHVPPSNYSSYPLGSKLPTTAPKFNVTDRTARQKFGLPATGRVPNGTVKTGVIGKGGAGSSIKSGGSVGGKSGSGAGRGGSGGG